MRATLLIVGLLVGLIVAAKASGDKPVKSSSIKTFVLDNGLRILISTNKEKPEIVAHVVIRAGGKNDPDNATGLAHYLEHLMFKGTSNYGTSNYAAEKPLLDQIEALYETYRMSSDAGIRKSIYKKIDSLSYEASKYSIANEYDKMIDMIGGKSSNATTTYDYTVYENEFPSNQLENWAKIESDRYCNAAFRGFHTELETVYEEYNNTLTEDSRAVMQAVNSLLYPHHPYGKHAVIGTGEHLKNPSIKFIKQFYQTWYVPNNMAVCIAGDVDPQDALQIIKKHFGSLRPNRSLPVLAPDTEKAIGPPVKKVLEGVQDQQVTLAWSFPGQGSMAADTLLMMSSVFSSLLYADQTQDAEEQPVSYSTFINGLADYSTWVVSGFPTREKTADDMVKGILNYVEKMKKGAFDDKLVGEAVSKLRNFQEKGNRGMVEKFDLSFALNVPFEQVDSQLDRLAKISKADIVQFANHYLDKGYAEVIKKQNMNVVAAKIEKPAITPILTNRNEISKFAEGIHTSKVKPIEPVFIDYAKKVSRLKTKRGLDIVYMKNNEKRFNLDFIFDFGNSTDKYWSLALQYLQELDSPQANDNQLAKQLSGIGCSYNARAIDTQMFISLSGVAEHMQRALELVQGFMLNVKADSTILNSMIADIKTRRGTELSNPDIAAYKLQEYIMFNGENLQQVVANSELDQLKPEQLADRVKQLFSYKHRVAYYGPNDPKSIVEMLEVCHPIPPLWKGGTVSSSSQVASMQEDRVYLLPFNVKNCSILFLSSSDDKKYLPELDSKVSIYNSYFGQGTNSVVFQEIRESRGLAYSAQASYGSEGVGQPCLFSGSVKTQAYKASEAIKTFKDIVNNMPISASSFETCKNSLVSMMRSRRVSDYMIFYSYNSQGAKPTVMQQKKSFEQLQNTTLSDVENFHKKWIKNSSFYIGIVGDKQDLDLKAIGQYGKIVELSVNDVFGY